MPGLIKFELISYARLAHGASLGEGDGAYNRPGYTDHITYICL